MGAVLGCGRASPALWRQNSLRPNCRLLVWNEVSFLQGPARVNVNKADLKEAWPRCHTALDRPKSFFWVAGTTRLPKPFDVRPYRRAPLATERASPPGAMGIRPGLNGRGSFFGPSGLRTSLHPVP